MAINDTIVSTIQNSLLSSTIGTESQEAVLRYVLDDILLASSLLLNITIAGVLLLAIVYLSRQVSDPRVQLILVSGVLAATVSLSSYVGLFSGLTMNFINVPDGHVLSGDSVLTMWGRYLGWAFALPFIMVLMGLVAGTNWTKIITAVMFTFAMVVANIASVLTTSNITMRWLWFGLSYAFFLVVAYIILTDWAQDADKTGTEDIYTTLKIITVISWFGFILIGAVGVEGLAMLDVWMTSWGYSILDVLAKYVVILVTVFYAVDEPEELTGGEEYGSTR